MSTLAPREAHLCTSPMTCPRCEARKPDPLALEVAGILAEHPDIPGGQWRATRIALARMERGARQTRVRRRWVRWAS